MQKEVSIEKLIESLFSSIEHAYLLGKRNVAFIKSTYCQFLYGYRNQIEVKHVETDMTLKGQIDAIGEDGILDFLTIENKHYFFSFKEIKFLLN